MKTMPEQHGRKTIKYSKGNNNGEGINSPNKHPEIQEEIYIKNHKKYMRS